MAQQEVLREFLVELGFKTDESSLKKFTTGIEGATKGVVKLVGAISGAALTVSAGVAAFASNLEGLYYASQKAETSANNLKAIQNAARNLGASADDAAAAVRSVEESIRYNPGTEGLLHALGVQTRDANGNLRDTVQILADLGAELAKKPKYLSKQYASEFGLSDDMFRAIINPEFAEQLRRQQELVRNSGFDQAAEHAHQFMVELRNLGTVLERFGVQVADALMQRFGVSLKDISRWFEQNGQMVADRIFEITKAIMDLAEATIPAIKWLVEKFIEADRATDGWSTKIVALLAVLNAIGAMSIVTGIIGVAGAFTTLATNIGFAVTGATSLLGLLGRLTAAGAAFAGGYKVGEIISENYLEGTAAGDAIGKAGAQVLAFFGNSTAQEAVRQDTGQEPTTLGGLLGFTPEPAVSRATRPEERAALRNAPPQPPYRVADTINTITESVTGAANSAFGKLIAKGEGDYNSVNRGKAGGYKAGKEDLENMTVAQVMDAQRKGLFNAAGRYQLIKGTLSDAVRTLNVDPNAKFNRATQDRIFEQYLLNNKRRAIGDYISGKSDDLTAALRATAKEWASFADPRTGQSYYAGVGNNKASISAEDAAAALKNARAQYAGNKPGEKSGPQTPVNISTLTNRPSYTPDQMRSTVRANQVQPIQRTANTANTVQIAQNTTIHVDGAADPGATGRAVAGQQGRVNENLSRNLQSVIQ